MLSELMKSKKFTNTLMFFLKFRTFIALFLLFVFFSFTAPNFLVPTSLIIITRNVVIFGILAIGMTYVITTGGIDLSVGSVAGFSGMIAGGLIMQGLQINVFGIVIFFSIPMVILLTTMLGMAVGFVNGIVITKFNVPPFIATLGTMYIMRGLGLLRSNGATFPHLAGSEDLGNTGFALLGRGEIIGLPVTIWIFIVIGLIAAYVLKKTPLGWHIMAVGGNQRSAALSGIKVDRVKIYAYMFSGFCAAVVGLIATSQLMAAHPATGATWELNAIAAAVLGGTSMSGGIGSIGGTVVGAFVIGVLNDGMIMSGVSSFWQQVIRGMIIIVAVMIDQFQQKLQARLALESR
jgi:ribose/xylose/arabinose/galactoside ABC-type transport system permease subunit